MTLEVSVQNQIRTDCGQGPTRLFRQESSFFYTGKPAKLKDGTNVLLHPRLVRVGFDGQPDLGGWTTVVVTPEMVGQTIAIAVQIEVKRPKKNKRSDEQIAFIAFARSVGVRAGFARSVDEARKIIAGAP
jgi:hypothetical protein